MTPTKPISRAPRRAAALAAAGLAGALLLTACSSTGPPTETPAATTRAGEGPPLHAEHPGAADPEAANALAAAAAALTEVFTWQPATEDSRGAALARARPWLSGDLADAVDHPGPAPDPPRPDPDWARWAAQGTVVTATVTALATRQDGPGAATVTAQVTQTVLGTGVAPAAKTFRAEASLTRTPRGWRVASYRELMD